MLNWLILVGAIIILFLILKFIKGLVFKIISIIFLVLSLISVITVITFLSASDFMKNFQSQDNLLLVKNTMNYTFHFNYATNTFESYNQPLPDFYKGGVPGYFAVVEMNYVFVKKNSPEQISINNKTFYLTDIENTRLSEKERLGILSLYLYKVLQNKTAMIGGLKNGDIKIYPENFFVKVLKFMPSSLINKIMLT